MGLSQTACVRYSQTFQSFDSTTSVGLIKGEVGIQTALLASMRCESRHDNKTSAGPAFCKDSPLTPVPVTSSSPENTENKNKVQGMSSFGL
jgi:hypothetical protein